MGGERHGASDGRLATAAWLLLRHAMMRTGTGTETARGALLGFGDGWGSIGRSRWRVESSSAASGSDF